MRKADDAEQDVPLIGRSSWRLARVITESGLTAAITGGALLLVFGSLWFLLPWQRRRARS